MNRERNRQFNLMLTLLIIGGALLLEVLYRALRLLLVG